MPFPLNATVNLHPFHNLQIMHHLTRHRNIVELEGAYEDRHSVNLVMELCAGGELFD